MNITAIRGFNDVLPGAAALFREIETEAYALFSTYGYSEIILPVVEKTELFTRSIGETTDIVEKEMYTFADRRGDSLTLRPEGTAPAVRAYIEHKMYTVPVTRLYYTGPMFRYERPQKGRYRQFFQIGAEVLGTDHPGVDAEVMEMLMQYFARLGLSDVELQVNSLGCAECRPGYKEALLDFLSGVKDHLCENCQRRIDANPLRALDCKSVKCMEATDNAPKITGSLCGTCSDHFSRVGEGLQDLGVSFATNHRMVRGLDYYTGTTFEITASGLGAQNAVAAGGRYNHLVSDLGGPPTPCIGFAIGMERVALLKKEAGREGGAGGASTGPLTVFIALGDEAVAAATGLVRSLRSSGCAVVQDHSDGALKRRMKQAHRMGAKFVIILGSDELADKTVTVKDMSSADQHKVGFDELAGFVKSAAREG